MRKIISFILVLSLLTCTFVGCNEGTSKDDETTKPSVSQKKEESSKNEENNGEETESESVKVEEPETEEAKSEPKPEPKPEEELAPPPSPTLQLNKAYYSGHLYSKTGCVEKYIIFRDTGESSIITDAVYDTTYEEDFGEPVVHEHNGVKYYLTPYGGGGGYNRYTVSGNTISINNGEHVFTVVSDTSIKDSNGVIYTITPYNGY